tara:strand:- start:938 stop:1243 length:306 start_codon:yes stop_codon:yes gene_type:complete
MEYLNDNDYKEIKNIIEEFIDTPAVIENLQKSLKLFLDSKNSIEVPEKETRIEYIVVDKEDDESSKKIKRILKEADVSLDKFSDKTLNASKKCKKNRKVNC